MLFSASAISLTETTPTTVLRTIFTVPAGSIPSSLAASATRSSCRASTIASLISTRTPSETMSLPLIVWSRVSVPLLAPASHATEGVVRGSGFPELSSLSHGGIVQCRSLSFIGASPLTSICPAISSPSSTTSMPSAALIVTEPPITGRFSSFACTVRRCPTFSLIERSPSMVALLSISMTWLSPLPIPSRASERVSPLADTVLVGTDRSGRGYSPPPISALKP